MRGRFVTVPPGTRFGRLVTLVDRQRGQTHLRVVCDCGAEKVVRVDKLIEGSTVSCGCFQAERAVAVGRANATHGQSHSSPTWRTWASMNWRCSQTVRGGTWDTYGARGITVCDRWRHSFENFLADMGERPDGRTLDRIDNDGDYEPDNCRWATAKEQANNRRLRRDSRLLQ